jgi:hypothetical protein
VSFENMTTNRKTLPQIAKAIKLLEKHNISNVVEIGRLLQEAFDTCEHGEYGPWLKTEFAWSDQTALNYRSVYDLTQKPNNLDFAKLNISLSAVYLVAELLKDEDSTNQAAAKAIIKAAKQGRITRTMANNISLQLEYEKIDAERAAKAAEHPPGKPPSMDDLEAPIPDDADDDKTPPQQCDDESVEQLIEVLAGLKFYAIRQQHPAWPKAIEAIGLEKLLELSEWLQAIHDAHCKKSSVKAAADRAARKVAAS